MKPQLISAWLLAATAAFAGTLPVITSNPQTRFVFITTISGLAVPVRSSAPTWHNATKNPGSYVMVRQSWLGSHKIAPELRIAQTGQT